MTALKKAVAVFSAAAMCTCGTLLHTSEAFRGDVNDDGRIDSFDVVKCRKALLNSFSGGHGETSVRPHMYNFLRYIFKAK